METKIFADKENQIFPPQNKFFRLILTMFGLERKSLSRKCCAGPAEKSSPKYPITKKISHRNFMPKLQRRFPIIFSIHSYQSRGFGCPRTVTIDSNSIDHVLCSPTKKKKKKHGTDPTFYLFLTKASPQWLFVDLILAASAFNHWSIYLTAIYIFSPLGLVARKIQSVVVPVEFHHYNLYTRIHLVQRRYKTFQDPCQRTESVLLWEIRKKFVFFLNLVASPLSN